jgi:DNA polymerase elongation subunit (family B)
MIYLDVETYSQQQEPRFDDKIITIQYSEVGGKSEILKEWESDEKTILSRFYEYLRKKLETERTVMIIGFNLLLFDRDFLGIRLNFHGIDTLENIFRSFKKIFWKDLRYCLLPFNNFSFTGLSEEEIASKLKIRSPKYSNKDIRMFYDDKEYGKITEHIQTEMKFLSDLSIRMSKELDVVKKSLEQK